MLHRGLHCVFVWCTKGLCIVFIVFLGRRCAAFPCFPRCLLQSTDAWSGEGGRRQASKMCLAIKHHHAALVPPPPPHHSPLHIHGLVTRACSAGGVGCIHKPTPPIPNHLPSSPLLASRRSAAAKTPLVVARRERAAVLRRRKGHAGRHETSNYTTGHTGWCGCLICMQVDACRGCGASWVVEWMAEEERRPQRTRS